MIAAVMNSARKTAVTALVASVPIHLHMILVNSVGSLSVTAQDTPGPMPVQLQRLGPILTLRELAHSSVTMMKTALTIGPTLSIARERMANVEEREFVFLSMKKIVALLMSQSVAVMK